MKIAIGITQKLFLSILATTAMALLFMFVIMLWSINRGFHQYLHAVDQGWLQQVSARLEAAYSQEGNWSFLKENRRFFFGPQGHHDGPPRQQKPDDGGEGRPPHRPPPPPGKKGQPGFFVFDANRRPLWGNPEGMKELDLKPLIHNSRTVGYIAINPPEQFLSPPQLRFLSSQKSALMLAASGMALVVMIFSLPIANRLLRPVTAMAAATRDLASGKYAVRVPVSSSDELGQLARDFNAMALTLEKNEKARRQWVADISHELRTPLSILRGEIEALIEGVRSTTPEAIRSLHAEAMRMSLLVDDLYQLALSDLGTLTYHKEELDLAGILRDSLAAYQAEFERLGISLHTDLGEAVRFQVFADPERLRQLFGNLLDNSLKYTDPGGELTVRLVCRGSRATIDFADSAPGVPDEALERLFDRLYRVEASRSRGSGGSGLGLAICRNIVEAHEGSISAHPSHLGGVMVRVDLPLSGSCA